MNKKHCKAECGEIGICQTCGDIFDGTKNRCSLELNDYDGEWVCPATSIGDKLAMAILVIGGIAGIAKYIGLW